VANETHETTVALQAEGAERCLTIRVLPAVPENPLWRAIWAFRSFGKYDLICAGGAMSGGVGAMHDALGQIAYPEADHQGVAEEQEANDYHKDRDRL